MRRPLDLFLAVLAIGGALLGLRKTSSSTTLGRTGDTTTVRADAQIGLEQAETLTNLRLWIDEGRGVLRRLKDHNTVMIAASLSYYSLLAVFPAAIAAVSIYGLIAEPDMLESQILDITSALPTTTADFIAEQLRTIVSGSEGSLGFATAIGIVVALFSASAGTKAIISGTNIAYGVEETRSFLVLRGIAYGLTALLIVGLIGTVVTVAALPQIAEAIGFGQEAAELINVARFPVVFLLVVVGLGALYKWAPDRPGRLTKLINVGGVTAAILWVVATVGFSLYVNNFGTFGETYGTLTGLIVLMLWFFLSGLIVLGGAELNSEVESRRHNSPR